MALSTENKLYISLAVLAVLGGALFLQNKKDKEEALSYTQSGQAAALPKIELGEEDLKKIDKIQLTKPAGDAGPGVAVELTKSGEEWKLTSPVEAAANQPNVKSLLDNLKSLKVTELIDSTKANYGKFDVTDDKALHAVFSKGKDVALDLYFGESGGRGQMTRIAGKDGVYASKGYSSYLYARDVKGWRDLSILKFEEADVASVSIENAHGAFAFTLDKGKSTKQEFKPKDGSAQAIKNYDETKLSDLLRAYKALNADNFADAGKTPAELGLDKPTATIVFTLKDGAKREVRFGNTSEGSSRWAKATGTNDIWSVSSWAVDWATAEEKKFQKSEDSKKGTTDADHPNAKHFSSANGMTGHP